MDKSQNRQFVIKYISALYFIISLGLHLLLLISINSTKGPKQVKSSHSPNKKIFEIIPEMPPASTSTNLAKLTTKPNTATAGKKKISLADLQVDTMIAHHSSRNPKENVRDNDNDNDNNNDSNSYGANKNYAVFKQQSVSITSQIYQAILEKLDYPQELVDRNIQGIVKVKFFFGGNGAGYLEKFSTFDGNSNYLKVAVARTLRVALYNSDAKLKQRLSQITRPLEFTGIFNFQISTTKEIHFTNEVSDSTFFFYKWVYGGDRPIDLANKVILTAAQIEKIGVNLIDLFLWGRKKLFKTEYEKVDEMQEKWKLEKYKNDPIWEKTVTDQARN